MPRIARFTSVVAIALAAGHLVQSMAQHRPAAVAMATSKIPVDIVQLSAGTGPDSSVIAPKVPVVLIEAAPVMPSPPALTQPEVTAPIVAETCLVDLGLQAQPAGLIAATLTAPCHKLERIVLRHDGLAVTGRLDGEGRLAMTVPALAPDGQVDVLFGDGSKAHAALAIPEAATLRRFGVQWQGGTAFLLHGFENGADFGQIGDISATNPGVAGDGGGGFLTVLGDANVENPLLAQVYTFPADSAVHINVMLEASVTQQTCGHDLLGETMSSSGGQTTFTDLTLAMPDCSGIGDFLVLNNLASDRKIATN
ncbi:MAG: hypothetical protein ABI832_00420 [bacterium]